MISFDAGMHRLISTARICLAHASPGRQLTQRSGGTRRCREPERPDPDKAGMNKKQINFGYVLMAVMGVMLLQDL